MVIISLNEFHYSPPQVLIFSSTFVLNSHQLLKSAAVGSLFDYPINIKAIKSSVIANMFCPLVNFVYHPNETRITKLLSLTLQP